MNRIQFVPPSIPLASPGPVSSGLRSKHFSISPILSPEGERLSGMLKLSLNVRKFCIIQPADIGWPTGNGKKRSCSQAQLGQATCLAVASFLSISCGPSYVRRLH